MLDFVGNKLEVGDDVVYFSKSRENTRMYQGRVVGFTDKRVRINTEYDSLIVAPNCVVVYKEKNV